MKRRALLRQLSAGALGNVATISTGTKVSAAESPGVMRGIVRAIGPASLAIAVDGVERVVPLAAACDYANYERSRAAYAAGAEVVVELDSSGAVSRINWQYHTVGGRLQAVGASWLTVGGRRFAMTDRTKVRPDGNIAYFLDRRSLRVGSLVTVFFRRDVQSGSDFANDVWV